METSSELLICSAFLECRQWLCKYVIWIYVQQWEKQGRGVRRGGVGMTSPVDGADVKCNKRLHKMERNLMKWLQMWQQFMKRLITKSKDKPMPGIDRIDVSIPNPAVQLGPESTALICGPIVFLHRKNQIQWPKQGGLWFCFCGGRKKDL